MNQPPAHTHCVGILYCGDLGAALGRALRKAGVRAVTTCAGRSPRTAERAARAGVEILPTMDDVVATAEVLVSLVLPEAAVGVARECAGRKHLVRAGCLFIDANSVDLETLSSVHDVLTGAGIRFVDAAVHGGAARLEEMGVMYVSGAHAAEAEKLFRPALRVLSLGEQVGQATRMKLLMGGQSKCLNLLFLQIAVLAHRSGMLEQFLAESRTFYPEIMVAIERMLPTYPEHAARRVTELQSVEGFARSVGAPHQIVHAARDLLQAAAGAWAGAARPDPRLDIATIVKLAAAVPPLPEGQ